MTEVYYYMHIHFKVLNYLAYILAGIFYFIFGQNREECNIWLHSITTAK
jgi:hypothetical protein